MTKVSLKMNDQSSTSNDPLSPPKPALSADALTRRRLMLRGASGGAAALAALQPVGALATSQSTVLTCLNGAGKEALCTLSGVQSAAHSFGPGITRIPAKGKSKSYWKSNPWPSGCATVCAPNKLVGSLLSNCNSSYRSMTMQWLMANAASSIEADFICAYLNGTACYSATYPTASKAFPYSSGKVKEFWDAGGQTRTNAQTLFKAIQTLNS